MYGVILLGFATGCRAMTPIAVLCWFMWQGALPVTGLNYWEANFIAVAVFSVCAVGEYVGDTLPTAPSRKSLFPLICRVVLAMWIGVSVASSFLQPLAGGIVFGGVSAVIGAYVGYALRMRLARWVGRDLPVAVTESALTLALSFFALHGMARDWATEMARPVHTLFR